MADSVLGENAPLLTREDVEQLRQRAIAVGHPVGPAVDSGPHVVGAFGRRLLPRYYLGATLIVETLDPGLLHESLGKQELARAAVQQIIEPIAVGPGHHLAL